MPQLSCRCIRLPGGVIGVSGMIAGGFPVPAPSAPITGTGFLSHPRFKATPEGVAGLVALLASCRTRG